MKTLKLLKVVLTVGLVLFLTGCLPQAGRDQAPAATARPGEAVQEEPEAVELEQESGFESGFKESTKDPQEMSLEEIEDELIKMEELEIEEDLGVLEEELGV